VIPAADLDESGETTAETILDRIEYRLRRELPRTLVRDGDRINFTGRPGYASVKRGLLTVISHGEVHVQREGESFRVSYTLHFISLLPLTGLMSTAAALILFGISGSVGTAILFGMAAWVYQVGMTYVGTPFEFRFLLRRWALDLWPPGEPRPRPT
jgi:hypothetical protein